MTPTRTAYGALALTALMVASVPALAISRVDTPGMSCQKVKSIVQSEGAAILRYPSTNGSGQTLYDRYVRDRHSCLLGQSTERKSVPTADDPHCPVLRCFWPDHADDDRIRPRP